MTLCLSSFSNVQGVVHVTHLLVGDLTLSFLVVSFWHSTQQLSTVEDVGVVHEHPHAKTSTEKGNQHRHQKLKQLENF